MMPIRSDCLRVIFEREVIWLRLRKGIWFQKIIKMPTTNVLMMMIYKLSWRGICVSSMIRPRMATGVKASARGKRSRGLERIFWV